MTQPRRTLVSLSDTPYYHCIGRCVRRAFLCGQDFASGRNYEHRKQWEVERLGLLTEVFTIEVCAYAVLSNHYPEAWTRQSRAASLCFLRLPATPGLDGQGGADAQAWRNTGPPPADPGTHRHRP